MARGPPFEKHCDLYGNPNAVTGLHGRSKISVKVLSYNILTRITYLDIDHIRPFVFNYMLIAFNQVDD